MVTKDGRLLSEVRTTITVLSVHPLRPNVLSTILRHLANSGYDTGSHGRLRFTGDGAPLRTGEPSDAHSVEVALYSHEE